MAVKKEYLNKDGALNEINVCFGLIRVNFGNDVKKIYDDRKIRDICNFLFDVDKLITFQGIYLDKNTKFVKGYFYEKTRKAISKIIKKVNTTEFIEPKSVSTFKQLLFRYFSEQKK